MEFLHLNCRAGLGRLGSAIRNGSSASGTMFSHARMELHDLARRMKRKNMLRYTDLQLTRTLLVITSVFIMLNLPNYVYRIGIQIFHINDHVRNIVIAVGQRRNWSTPKLGVSVPQWSCGSLLLELLVLKKSNMKRLGLD